MTRIVRAVVASTAVVAAALSAGAGAAQADYAANGDQMHYVLRSNVKGIDYLSWYDGRGVHQTRSDQLFKHETPKWWFAKWTYTSRGANYAAISASSEGKSNSTWIECEVWVNGVKVEHEASQGPYASVYC
ncbi:hypothetical protein GONAM_15_01140 [Gordonia namibiensis NBRC 108229]|uniref:Secreted protein n=1 Tax=Gordonia namibiensis NBRC 108229 TaxID=1208314 RepID=K6WLZ1_9ACTN|nr:hypothetical protein [Gordonia namibiensis]GAC00406.1 hypothetical protein GONAM_15_01140 [Gordonia namibiensis NBRC 108229]